MRLNMELSAFMNENGPEIELLKRRTKEIVSTTKTQGVRLQAVVTEDTEITAI